MCIFPVLHKISARAVLAFAIGIAGAPHAALADDFAEASKLFKAGQYEPALARVNKAISAKPGDPGARFLKGLILTEQGNSKQAVEVFLKLTQDYPALPEPYNNLAVIYASQGEYEKARVALEKSINTHPSYATAYENLGDVYARLASQAYNKALKIDSRNTVAQGKLALARELVGGAARPGPEEAVAVAPAPAPAITQQSDSQQRQMTRPPPSDTRTASAPRNVQRESSAPAVTAAPPAASAAGGGDVETEVRKALEGWAQAWSRKDPDAYLAHYAADFVTPNGQSRAQWENTRRERIAAPKSIAIGLSSVKVSPSGAARATASFRQEYRSDIFTGSSRKTLVLIKDGDRWLIKQESVK